MIDIKQIEMEFNTFFGDKENENNLLKRMEPLIAEIKRLREGIKGAIYLFQEGGNSKMTDKKRLDVICDTLLEVIE